MDCILVRYAGLLQEEFSYLNYSLLRICPFLLKTTKKRFSQSLFGTDILRPPN